MYVQVNFVYLCSKKKLMRLAIVGATGAVGQELLQGLAERSYPVEKLWLAASDKKKGRKLNYQSHTQTIHTVEEVLRQRPNVAIFSAGATTARKWTARFVEAGCRVIDNSSAWRMKEGCPLVVPEVNGDTLGDASIIANPNCATIQLVMALYPLQKHFGLCELTLSTYQAVSGAGNAALVQLSTERSGKSPKKQALPQPIHENIIPQIGPIEKGHSEEERKIKQEVRKILQLPKLPVHVTCTRVPLVRGHSESVYLRTEKPVEVVDAISALRKQSGLKLYEKSYPTPQQATHQDLVHVGRLRKDEDDPYGLHLWVVADNLRKGAATNALQIMEAITK